ncbi:MAG TPA: helix-turn-helix domain-containing protein, partial [Pseudonocardiaceae bacterium]|nr:helix-turn-helix domain-containing protein [Pseudonocardiaceae bacterium]
MVRTAWSHRDNGASWSEIAIAIGVTKDTLRRWRRADNAKPMLPSGPPAATPSHTELPGLPRAHTESTSSGFGTISAKISQSQSQHLSFTASASISAHDRIDIESALTSSSRTRR